MKLTLSKRSLFQELYIEETILLAVIYFVSKTIKIYCCEIENAL